MATKLFLLPFRPALSATSLIIGGAQLGFYQAGTLIKAPVYADAAQTVPLQNPVPANIAGVFPSIYMDDAVLYRVVLYDSIGAVLNDADPYLPSQIDNIALNEDVLDAIEDITTEANRAETAQSAANGSALLAASWAKGDGLIDGTYKSARSYSLDSAASALSAGTALETILIFSAQVDEHVASMATYTEQVGILANLMEGYVEDVELTRDAIANDIEGLVEPVLTSVASRTILKAVNPTNLIDGSSFYLGEGRRAGPFRWRTGNYSTLVATDVNEGLYIAHASIPATSGAFVRDYIGTAVNIDWFGAVPDYVSAANRGTDSGPAIRSALALSRSVYGNGSYYCATTLAVTRTSKIFGPNGFDAGRWPFTINFPRESTGIFFLRGDTTTDAVGNVTRHSTSQHEGGDGSELVNVHISGIGSGTAVPNVLGKGIRTNCRISIYHCRVGGFADCGFYSYASSNVNNLDPEQRGNSNGTSIDGLLTAGNLLHGIYISGPDANVFHFKSINATGNGGWGIYDNAFLHSTYTSCQVAGNGERSYVRYGGNLYYALVAHSNVVPGTDPTVWEFWRATGSPDDWSPTASYVPGGAYAIVNDQNRAVMSGCYSESNQPPSLIMKPAIVLGGNHSAGFRPASDATRLIGQTLTNITEINALAVALGSPSPMLGLNGTASYNTARSGGFTFSNTNVTAGVYEPVARLRMTPSVNNRSVERGGFWYFENYDVLDSTWKSHLTISANGSNYQFYPSGDGVFNIGRPANRYNNSYFAVAPTVSSDLELKQGVEAIDDELLDVWTNVKSKMYKMRDAVAQKGEANARVHFGLVAQEVRDAFLARGIDGRKYGLLGYDEWPDEYGTDDNGNQTLVRAAGHMWSLRYTEVERIEAAWQRRRADRLEARLNSLVARVEALETA